MKALPQNVAHMNFFTPKFIYEAILHRASQDTLGYYSPTAKQYLSVQRWQKKRNQFVVEKDWIIFSQSSTFSLAILIHSLSKKNDKILFLSPAYPPFFSNIKNLGRKIVTSDLIRVKNQFKINYEDFEKKIKKCKVFLFCNPHNPTGKHFSKSEIKKVVDICKKNDVKIISDEVHSDIVYLRKHITISKASKYAKHHSATIFSIGKSFNTSGLKISYLIIENAQVRERVIQNIKANGGSLPNIFGIYVLQSCYSVGEKWLNSIIQKLYNNSKIIEKFFANNEFIKVCKNEATFLSWLDCNKITKDDVGLAKYLQTTCDVSVYPGSEFGATGKGYLRLNFAMNKKRLVEMLNNFQIGLTEYKNNKSH